MKNRTKARLIVGIAVLIIVLAMMAPLLSVFIKIDDGGVHLTADISIGEDAVFTIRDDTPESSVSTNISNAYDRGGRIVVYGLTHETLGSKDDADTVADNIMTAGATSYSVTDENGKIVRMIMVDESTDDDKIITVTMKTSEMAAKYTKPDLKLYFEKGDFKSMTDSKVEINGGMMKLTVSIPMSTFTVLQAMGCDVVMDLNVSYIFLMSFSMIGNLGNLMGIANTTVTIDSSTGTETFDISLGNGSSIIADLISSIDGGDICGLGISASVSGELGTVKVDLGTYDSLSSFLKDMTDEDGKIIITYSGSVVTIEKDQAEQIVKFLTYLEGASA